MRYDAMCWDATPKRAYLQHTYAWHVSTHRSSRHSDREFRMRTLERLTRRTQQANSLLSTLFACQHRLPTLGAFQDLSRGWVRRMHIINSLHHDAGLLPIDSLQTQSKDGDTQSENGDAPSGFGKDRVDSFIIVTYAQCILFTPMLRTEHSRTTDVN